MLVLSRKRDESLLITCGEKTIEVVVKATSKGVAKLGIAADKDVSIKRTELVHRTGKSR